MALRIEYETHYGITCDYAHCIVRDARVNKEVNEQEVDGETVTTTVFDVHYNGKIFASDDAYADGASPIGGFNGSFELNTAGSKNQYNLVKQSYLHLKEQDGFTDGTDC
tara:strand:- start:34 stop:360 length:327 start_codon:yes stop_codon:yes gene_type:complete